MFAIRDKNSDSFLVAKVTTYQVGGYDSNEEFNYDTFAHLELISWDRENSDSDVIFVSSKEVCEELLGKGKCEYPKIEINDNCKITDLEMVELEKKTDCLDSQRLKRFQ